MAVKLNPRLGPAIAVFRELGWAQAPIGTAPDLPLGTPEQRRIAVAGLASGQWSEFGELGNGRWGRISAIDVDETMLAIFAIRAGVDARRAVTIVPRVDDELIARIVGERGPAFAVRFIDGVCRASLRMWEHSCSFHGGAAVRLVADLRLEVPQNVDYLKDWVALALEQVAIELRDASDGRQPPRDPATAWRFMEHLAAAAALGVPATGPFGRLVPLAVSGGWIERDAAVALSFQALDSAQRPGDRRRWAEVLVDDLAVRDDEVVARAEELVPALASGEPGVVEWFAPILIRGVDEGQLAEVAMAALMVGTRKAQRIVIDALATRRAPRLDVIEVLAARLTELAGDKDRGLARATASLVRAWEVPAPEPVVEVVAPRGLWQPTPPVWQVPDFDPGPLTAEALTEAAAELLHGAQEAVGLAVERFLVIANAVARTDPDSARRALRGVRDEVWVSGLRPVPAWVGGHLPTRGLDATLTGRASAFPVLVAREYAVFQRLGAVPQLLSRPSSVDLQVRVADLVGRLGRYLAVGASAIEADFLLALARLDATGADAGMADSLSQLAVPVLRQDGVPLRSHAGQILRRYLADPLVDPGVVKRERDGAWWCADLVWPASLSEFPHRIRVGYGDPTFAEVPSWGDAAMTGVCWTGEVDRDLGVVARQLARRGRPLPPGASINLLAIQRSVHPAVAEDVAIAVVEAWQRGILRPGVADVRFLDWSGTREASPRSRRPWSKRRARGSCRSCGPWWTTSLPHRSPPPACMPARPSSPSRWRDCCPRSWLRLRRGWHRPRPWTCQACALCPDGPVRRKRFGWRGRPSPGCLSPRSASRRCLVPPVGQRSPCRTTISTPRGPAARGRRLRCPTASALTSIGSTPRPRLGCCASTWSCPRVQVPASGWLSRAGSTTWNVRASAAPCPWTEAHRPRPRPWRGKRGCTGTRRAAGWWRRHTGIGARGSTGR